MVDLEQARKYADRSLPNSSAWFIAEMADEITLLREALRKIMKDDEDVGHPCGPPAYRHFGNIARDALQETPHAKADRRLVRAIPRAAADARNAR
jgi:hypothetical protein